jgi:GAF domain-containing protein/ActR/RegA family two-component response regulator
MADRLEGSYRELEQKVAEKTRDLSALYAVTGPIGRAHDLNAVMDEAVAKILTVTGADGASVRLLDATGTRVTVAAYRGFPEAYVEAQAPIGQFNRMGREVLRTGQPVVVADLVGDPVYGRGPLVRNGYRSAACLPLVASGAPLGVMTLAAKQAGQITPGQRELFAAIAHQIAVAIENAHLYTEAVQKRAEAEALQELGRLISSTLDQEEIFRVLIERTCRVLGVTRCALWECRPEGDGVGHHLRHGVGLNPQIWGGAHLRLGEGVTGGCLVRRAPVWTADCLADQGLGLSPATLERARAEGYRSLCAAPILLPDCPFGALVIYRDDVHPFEAREVALLSAFANQAAIAIQNAQLFHAAKQRAQEIAAIHEAGQAITESLDQKTTLTRIAENTRRLAGAGRSYVWLVDPADGTLEGGIAAGLGAEAFLGARIAADSPAAAARAAREKRIIPVPDALDASAADPALSARLGNAALLAIPLRVAESVPAVLVLGYDQPQTFADGEVDRLGTLAQQAAIAIQNARLFHEEQERRRQVEAVRAVTEEVARELNLTKLLQLIHRRAVELAGATQGVMWIWDGEAQVLVPKAWYGHGETFRDARVRLGEGCTGMVAQQRAGMIVNDYQVWPHANPLFRDQAGVRAVLSEPLLYRDRLVGVISVEGHEEDRPFTDQHRQTLALFAAQAAIAIENARLYEESQRQAREATALAEVGRALSESLDMDRVLERIVVEVRQTMEAAFVGVMRLDEGRQELSYVAGVGLPRERFARMRLKVGEGITSPAIVEGAPTHIPDLSGDPRVLDGGIVQTEGYRSLFCAPLLAGDRVLGSIDVFRREAGPFTPAEVQLLTRFADHAAIAIENARLFQEEQLRRQQVEAVRVVTEDITRELDLAILLELIAHRAAELSKTTASVIYVWDEAAQVLVPRAWHGFADWIRDLRLRLGEGLAGTAAKRRERVQVSDYRTSPHAHPLVVKHTEMTAAIAEPLLHHDRLVGVIVITNQGSGRRFDEQDYTILSLFASQAAIAIENARLYEQVATHAGTLERRVRERTAEVERANRAKSEFLANMSHELRTPLNAVIGFAQMLAMKSFGPLTPKQTRYVTNIQNGGVHLLNLVNDILDLAKVEAGRLELRRERVSLGDIVAQAMEVVRPAAEGKGLALAAELAQDLPPLHADPIRLRQVLVNLLSNSVKFTEACGRVTVHTAAEGTCVEMRVADTGIGVAPEDLPRLFRKFEQLHSGLAKPHQGTGLGLALTKHLVELHGGTIGVASPGRGRGTTFTVRLPAGPGRDRPRVLVVEDDPAMRETLLGAMAVWGWEATAAESLAAARTALEADRLDLMLLDSALPDGSGVDFVGDVRSRSGPRLPILVYTGLGAEEAQAAMAAGADEYLVKPAPLEAVQRKAATLLARAGWPAASPGPAPQATGGPAHDVTPSPAAASGS